MKPVISRSVSAFKCTKSPVREIMDLANPQFFQSAGLDPAAVISFSGGWVNHAAPVQLREAFAAIIRDEKRFHCSGGYSPTVGLPECRSAIADYEKHLYGDAMKLSPEQIAIGSNSTQLTFNLMHIMLSPGDKLLLPDPSYSAKLYETAAQRTVQAINEHLKLPCLVPQGGLYTVVRTGVESSEFTRLVLERTGVIVVPGWGFGDTLKHAVRLSYGPLVHDLDKIDAAMKRVGRFLATRST